MKKFTFQVFVDKSILIHKNKYIYHESTYTNTKNKTKITCPIHGEFEQTPTSHLRGCGCSKCGRKIVSDLFISNKEEFIARSNIIHNNKYDYSKVVYVNSLTKVKIICPEHGVFEQIPGNHNYNGCPKCGKYGYKKRNWLKSTERNKRSYLYVVKCFNDVESFVKIGITSMKLRRRFRKEFIPYNYEIINLYVSSPDNVWNEEKRIHRVLKSYKHTPKIKFSGYTECYTFDVLPIGFS